MGLNKEVNIDFKIKGKELIKLLLEILLSYKWDNIQVLIKN
jgi:hypothetical protein